MPNRRTKLVESEGCWVRVVHEERVKRASSETLAPERLDALTRLFKTLGDPTRLRIVLALRDGEMCVCDLAAFLGITDSAVSHQLRHLREQALVRARRDGQVLYYALDDDHVDAVVRVGLEHVAERY